MAGCRRGAVELNEGTSRHRRPKVEGGPDLDEGCVERAMALLKPLVTRCRRAQLAHWIFLDRASDQSNEREHAEARRRLLEAMGGPPGPACYGLHRGGGR